MRLTAVFVGFWMVMLPQMLNARALSTPDEYGSRPAPVNEEEVKHLNIFELAVIGMEPKEAPDGTVWAGLMQAHPILAQHGEVPHPPPWSIAR